MEVLGNELTAPDLIQRTLTFYEGLGKVPIELKKSVPGHIANRLQAVLWQEVLPWLEGVASLSDIDKVIANGPGLRWAIYGPNQLFSLAAGAKGLEGFLDHLGPSFQDWWSAAGHVELDADTRQFIKRQYSSFDENECRAMKAYRDHLICRILNEKIFEEGVLVIIPTLLFGLSLSRSKNLDRNRKMFTRTLSVSVRALCVHFRLMLGLGFNIFPVVLCI